MGCCCSFNKKDTDGFSTYDKMSHPAQKSIDMILYPESKNDNNFLSLESNTTSLLKDINFAPIDESDSTSHSTSHEIDDDTIKGLLNSDEEEVKDLIQNESLIKEKSENSDFNEEFVFEIAQNTSDED